ncbi:MAG: DUF3592 domain-containing protein [Oscillatoria sp. PMC 1068.18]|nr:DUF3592 domain-containing protein [Oscillatoria sp. PMC 1076.18]MEC4987718.1 DUF3592 domain-containing protein [Oscillatoria sp. PMC 1068.18]
MPQSSTDVLQDRLQRIGVGLIFILIPLLYCASLGTFLVKLYQMGNWVKTPGTIVEVDLVEGRYASGRGGANTPYSQCQARYSYSFAGQPFEGTQVSLYNEPDFETSSFHERICRDLLEYQESEQSFQIYVNPDDPSEAILYRDVFWGKAISPLVLMVAVLFGAGGILLIRSAFVPQTEPKQQDDPLSEAVTAKIFETMREVEEARKNEPRKSEEQVQDDDYYATNTAMFLERFFDKMTELGKEMQDRDENERKKSAEWTDDDKN